MMSGAVKTAFRWLRARDQGLNALRRATRTAIVMPTVFAIGSVVLDNPTLATFAAFGAFAQLLLVGFSGSARDRMQSQLALAACGAALVCLGTLLSQWAWAACLGMLVVGFVVLFSGVVSSVLASAANALLLAFVLPVSFPGAASTIPDRVSGWLMAGAAALVANELLWPAPAADPLRGGAITSCRLLAERLQTAVAFASQAPGSSEADRDRAAVAAREGVATMLGQFYATPYRPTALTTSARALVRLIDELGWLGGILDQAPPDHAAQIGNRGVCTVKSAAASVLHRSADLLAEAKISLVGLDEDVARLNDALEAMESDATRTLPLGRPQPADADTRNATRVVSALEPSFRAQELGFAVGAVATNVRLAIAADRRTWWQRLLGRQPVGIDGPFAAAQERATSHLNRRSVWLHNSIRGAVGLAVAVLIADLSGVQHSFWVVLGTLSMLRSNALNTGQTIVKAMAGTIAGLVIGSVLIVAIGTNSTVLWVLLPVAITFAGFAPAAISFAAGQAGFSITVLILFNILAPAGWEIGLVRLEDVAIGSGVSLLVGLLLWPRGAAAALRDALAEAYTDSADYLSSAVEVGTSRCDGSTPVNAMPATERIQAAAAARRLDDAFRQFLNERGERALPLAEATRLVTVVAGIRLAADAVVDLWSRETGAAGGDRAASREELYNAGALVTGWYSVLADALRTGGPLPSALPVDSIAGGRLMEAVRRDLQDDGGQVTPTAARMIWTADHLDAVRRFQDTILGPAHDAAKQQARSETRMRHFIRTTR
jgi:uncharacterized membrane protein YccC